MSVSEMQHELASTLAHLPPFPPKRIAIHVKPAAERALREGHPWLFDGAIQKQSREGEPGALAVIFDRKDRFLAVGLYDPDSHIRVKVLQHNTPAKINAAWFHQTLDNATAVRLSLAQSGTDGYRMVYGESDHMPGFVVDRYADTLVVKLYTAAWLPHLRDVLSVLVAVQPCDRMVLRLSRNLQDAPEHLHGLYDGQTLIGEPPAEPLTFTENGLKFAADVLHGHKTGFFFDQRENRQRVRELSASADVLDVFAYSGGFSVYAAAGGAKSVLSLDVSRQALEAAQHNFALNRDHPSVARAHHEIMVADAFDGLSRLRSAGRQFDVVVIDPPAFAKQQSEVVGALRAYARLAEVGTALVKPGGKFVMASCSSRVPASDFFDTVTSAATCRLHETARTAHALDHPVGFREAAYLKCLFVIVDLAM